MSSANSMALYRELLPRLSMPGKRKTYDDIDVALILLDELHTVTVFDCRTLPTTFVDDTGDAVYDELEQTKEHIHLPFNRCYFEFADEPKMIYAEEIGVHTGNLENCVENGDAGTYVGHELEIYDLSINTAYSGVGIAFGFGELPSDLNQEFYSLINPGKREKETHWDKVGRRVLAVATLLGEQLVLDKLRPDPAPKITRERKLAHKPPVSSDIHVLTVNVPIIRYRVQHRALRVATHDSPMLHWRRGHWRIYNRGTNFESTGWVQRCLVGDPAKGYIRNTQYRLVHRPTPFRIINGGRVE